MVRHKIQLSVPNRMLDKKAQNIEQPISHHLDQYPHCLQFSEEHFTSRPFSNQLKGSFQHSPFMLYNQDGRALGVANVPIRRGYAESCLAIFGIIGKLLSNKAMGTWAPSLGTFSKAKKNTVQGSFKRNFEGDIEKKSFG